MTDTNETAGKTAKKRELVILSLKKSDAEELSKFFKTATANYPCQMDRINKISMRIEKALNNIEARNLGYPRGTKQMQEEGALNQKMEPLMETI